MTFPAEEQPEEGKEREERGGVQSVQRALDLLETFPMHGPEIGLSQMASLNKMSKATVYRLLSNLEQRGYVVRSPINRKYRLGVRVFELGSYFQSQLEVRRMGLHFLREMVEQSNESAFLCIQEGDEALCIERVESQQEVNIFSLRVGGKQPLHWGGAPRALLVGMDERQLIEYAHRTGLPAKTPRTIHNLEALLADVHLTRQRGYALSIDDVVTGISAVGAPICDHTGRIVASISLSGLSSRYGPQLINHLAQIVINTAARFSSELGYRDNTNNR
jgi:IclR family transcriptional regulator, KDG regulon repressor